MKNLRNAPDVRGRQVKEYPVLQSAVQLLYSSAVPGLQHMISDTSLLRNEPERNDA